ncbi:helix-turn-helix domain-containing protein [Brochothrix thermosphacta]
MLANRLKKARKRKKITQQEVADALNFSRQSLSKWHRYSEH